MDPWLEQNLVCPRTHKPLERRGDALVSPDGHSYPIIDDIPIMLLDEAEPTNPIRFENTRERLEDPDSMPPEVELGPDEIDPLVRENVRFTCGRMYSAVGDRLKRYPIPAIPLPPGEGRRLLDLGCGWGRWSIAAARGGYRPVGMDPSIDRARVARRIARQVGVEGIFLVADGRYLPFADRCFDQVYSFGVLQHLSKPDVRTVLPHVRRVLKPGAGSLIQMATKWGLHNPVNRLKQVFRPFHPFQVRFWSQRELARTFNDLIGPSRFSADAFLTLNAQASDLDILPWRYRTVVRISEALRRLSRAVPAVRLLADSVFIESVVDAGAEGG